MSRQVMTKGKRMMMTAFFDKVDDIIGCKPAAR